MHAQREDADHDVDLAATAHRFPRVTSFRSRHAALSDRQQETWERRWPELGTETRHADGTPAEPIDAEA